MTKTNTQAAAPTEPTADPKTQAMWDALGKDGAAKLGAILGELDAELVKRGFEPPDDAVQLVEMASKVAAEEMAATSVAGVRIPKGARQPMRRRTVDVNGLSARELAMCAKKKLDPAKYAEKRRQMKSRGAK